MQENRAESQVTAARSSSLDEASPSLASSSTEGRDVGIEFYRLLVGCDPTDADLTDDRDFDRHVLASVLSIAAMDGGPLSEKVGLVEQELDQLRAKYFPSGPVWPVARTTKPGLTYEDEIIMVRDLLLAQRSTEGEVSRWLAAMIARRAMEANHLWEDLGLRQRAELSRLLTRHFAPLAARNTKNMRWKRFIYRTLCEDDGLVMCTTPVCTQCNDFDLCFGEESGESRMAERRREFMRDVEEHVKAASH
ncbi:hypothetical protein AYJ54_18935 [Bradyrhizobium centrolobii]|uniref:Nitrogen fixation protein NifQ n=2 Tax=Bradyrhizobium TaxID=374 RepID=A0A176ZH61_9BRAD|nr:hypothetical protein AYJ54_18935 [Bradyrhizobium centrolobii]OAF19223.1 hypothetical protein AXW67_37840 [Bradyrhizobium neotropicale]